MKTERGFPGERRRRWSVRRGIVVGNETWDFLRIAIADETTEMDCSLSKLSYLPII